MSEKSKFKFDVVIGNPPFQESMEGTSDKPIYPDFLDSAYKVSNIAEFITKAGFLFNAGKTKDAWNKKMLEDPHIKILFYEPDASKVFPNVGFKGGVTVSLRNINKNYGPIQFFSAFSQLQSIVKKVINNKNFEGLDRIIYSSDSYKLTSKLHTDFPSAANKLSNGHKFDVTTNIFNKLSEIFLDDKPSNNQNYVQVYGRKNNERSYKYIKREYISGPENFEYWKVILPKSNGSGALGEVLSTPLIGEPLIGVTQTFLTIGKFDTAYEAKSLFKYVKGKFSRALLGALKVTQHNPAKTWKYVPLQDFTKKSDIDWSKPIHEIDLQLYKKYNLNDDEINFIETKVKEMD